MITVSEQFLNKGAAYKAVFILDQLERMELATTKDVVAMAPDRDTALELKQNIIDEIDVFDHNVTGRMENSIGVRKMGDEYGVTAVDYAKYVNGRDRENEGQGFIDAAVQQTIIDTGEDVILLV
jgi:hypothetical protein